MTFRWSGPKGAAGCAVARGALRYAYLPDPPESLALCSDNVSCLPDKNSDVELRLRRELGKPGGLSTESRVRRLDTGAGNVRVS
jgi:hypothetical protein